MNISKGLLAFRAYDSRLLSLSQFFYEINYTSTGTINDTIKKFQIRSIGTSQYKGTTLQDSNKVNLSFIEKETNRKAKISKSMKAYLQRSLEQKTFMKEKITEYEIGKRHLANMMGENPETFTQDDIDKAIKYLLPSGLFESSARPMMKHPHQLYPKQKDAEFNEMGRPHKSLFYTGKPAFYQIFQQIALKAQELELALDKMEVKPTNMKMITDGSKWVSKEKMEGMIFEMLKDEMYDIFIRSMERLVDHPLSSREEKFIMSYREMMKNISFDDDIPELMYKENGTPYMTAIGLRKTCKANVTVWGGGTGKIDINGEDILYFDSIQDREQVMFPLQFVGLMRSVDVKATVEGGRNSQLSGKSGQAGAIRYALSTALRSFTDTRMVEKMRIAGLLTADPRKKERKKPGQRRARAKFTWKKR